MSRIEKALEKASQLRQNTTEQPSIIPTEIKLQKVQPIIADVFPSRSKSISITNPLLVSAIEPDSPIAEEYRKLKTSLAAISRQDGFSNVFMISSALPSEGKSLTALNMALSMAQDLDHTVLLIDADLRNPSIHRYLGLDADIGLAEVLEERADIGDVLVHSGIGKLVLLPAGIVSVNPVELFSSQRMVKLLDEIKNRYPDRFVIIDTPPILPFAETAAIGRLVDGVVLVVKERLASQASIRDAITALKGIRIIGVVYNDAAISPIDDRYGRYYKNYYYRAGNSKTTESR